MRLVEFLLVVVWQLINGSLVSKSIANLLVYLTKFDFVEYVRYLLLQKKLSNYLG